MHRKVAGVVAVVLLLGGAGCGGGKSSGGGSSKAPTFAQKADATCAKTRDAALAEQKAILKAQGSATQVATKVIALNSKMIDELGAIQPPDALAARYHAYLAALHTEQSLSQQVMKAAGKKPDGALRDNSPAAKLALQRHDLRHKIVPMAQALGFKVCGA